MSNPEGGPRDKRTGIKRPAQKKEWKDHWPRPKSSKQLKLPDRVRILRMDNETQVMQWDEEKKEWVWQYTLLGDFDIELAPDFDCNYPDCMINKIKESKK